ncbi:hypothetical protein AALB39_18355, partial [Lachnospiraceae bacterium 54-53]
RTDQSGVGSKMRYKSLPKSPRHVLVNRGLKIQEKSGIKPVNTWGIWHFYFFGRIGVSRKTLTN